MLPLPSASILNSILLFVLILFFHLLSFFLAPSSKLYNVFLNLLLLSSPHFFLPPFPSLSSSPLTPSPQPPQLPPRLPLANELPLLPIPPSYYPSSSSSFTSSSSVHFLLFIIPFFHTPHPPYRSIAMGDIIRHLQTIAHPTVFASAGNRLWLTANVSNALQRGQEVDFGVKRAATKRQQRLYLIGLHVVKEGS